ncbi:N-acetylmuramoyl-L-alanine amidase family protein [Lacrimispora sp.]|uniref:N-acetylmuramoyl-L-alanine amidase family protein n=1 Tax=Lacrimispora sp. TaxID=2719234 RepID=UPI00285AB31E|nr:N-acetylmuramoyl-L-alanine amidase [Lacrimispora sp.]MDR7813404.1 N-acetylmuramoyl-L-alanine amidase [Lacrimispora sp.]
MKICLDAGHYGKYNKSPADGRYYESDMVWKLHLMLKRYLEEYGIQVITTRINQETDKVLYDRGTASAGCNLFVSLHSNATGTGVNNAVDYPVSYCSINHTADDIGLVLAKAVQVTMQTKQAARIEHRSGSNGDYYGVLRGATAVGTPALILEHSFHTNAAVTAWLLNDANLDRMAKAEADTIAAYYGIQKEKKSGWKQEDGGWRFYLGDSGFPVRNDWVKDQDKWYWFNGAGIMVTNTWYQHKGNWYYLNADGVMLKGTLIVESGKVYCLDGEGKMVVEPVMLTPGQDGALQYPGLSSL